MHIISVQLFRNHDKLATIELMVPVQLLIGELAKSYDVIRGHRQTNSFYQYFPIE